MILEEDEDDELAAAAAKIGVLVLEDSEAIELSVCSVEVDERLDEVVDTLILKAVVDVEVDAELNELLVTAGFATV